MKSKVRFRRRVKKGSKLARKVSSIAKHIGSTELKGINNFRTANAMSNVFASWNVFPVAQGNDYNNRTGDQIKPIKISLKWWMQNTNNANYYWVRGILVRVWDNTGTITMGNLLDVAGAADTGPASLNPVYTKIATGDKYISSGKTYEVLFDTGFKQLSPLLATATSTPNQVAINFKKKLSGRKPIHYTGTAAGNLGEGAILWVTWAQNVACQEYGNTEGYFVDD